MLETTKVKVVRCITGKHQTEKAKNRMEQSYQQDKSRQNSKDCRKKWNSGREKTGRLFKRATKKNKKFIM